MVCTRCTDEWMIITLEGSDRMIEWEQHLYFVPYSTDWKRVCMITENGRDEGNNAGRQLQFRITWLSRTQEKHKLIRK